MPKLLAAASLALSLALASSAHAVEPISGGGYNMTGDIDFKNLSRSNFYDVIVPKAKAEGTVTLFDFSNSFENLFRNHLIPGFEKKYGVKVDYQRGDGRTAAQQLIATNNVGQPAPFDAFYVGVYTLIGLYKTDAVAKVPLYQVLPSADKLDEKLVTTSEGINHGGLYLIWHRNQTTLAYNTRFVKEGTQPKNFAELLTWAKANKGRFAVTNPTKGGSGDGFMQSVTLALVKGDECRKQLADYTVDEAKAKAYVTGECMAPVWNYYKELLAASEVTSGNADTLNLMTNGEAWIGTAWEDMAYDFSGRGLLPPTVRLTLMQEGHVGGGDGFFLPSRPAHPAAALLLMDYMMSKEAQETKLKVNGSRTLRTDLEPEKAFSEAEQKRLIPAAELRERARTNIPRPIIQAASAYVQENLLRK